MGVCIYCQKENLEPSAEHVIAESLGGRFKLPPELVCKDCNNLIGKDIDVPVAKDLNPVLTALEVVGKSGKPATMKVEEETQHGLQEFEITKDEICSAHPVKCLFSSENEYEFLASSEQELEKQRKSISKKKGKEFILSKVEKRVPQLREARRDEVDFRKKYWAGWAAKTCLNVISSALGGNFARRADFDELRALTLGSKVIVPCYLRVGGCGSGDVETDEALATCELSVLIERGQLEVVVKLFDFCGFNYRKSLDRAVDFSWHKEGKLRTK